jgi:DNA-directed RNA polymerase subunit alpha
MAAGDPIAAPVGGGGGGGGGSPSGDVMSTPVSDLNLSVRSGNCLQAENIETVGDLLEKSEDDLLQLRNFGRTSLTEVKEKLAELGLSLKGGSAAPSDEEAEEEEEPVNPETTATA